MPNRQTESSSGNGYEEIWGPVLAKLFPGGTYGARLVLRPQGEHNGVPLTMVVGVIHGDPRQGPVRDHNLDGHEGDELLICELAIKPYQRFEGERFQGEDAGGLLMNGGVYPGSWERQVEGPLWIPPKR